MVVTLLLCKYVLYMYHGVYNWTGTQICGLTCSMAVNEKVQPNFKNLLTNLLIKFTLSVIEIPVKVS